MQQRVADYIADFLVEHGINRVFSVVGGGAMYMNDALGNKEGLDVVYTQHEQGAAIGAEGHARITGRACAICVTSGPGGTNAMTGVLGAYQDSVPMLVLSGQVRYNTTVSYMEEETGWTPRQFGEQEYTIIPSVTPMTKYAVMVKDPLEIRYHLERALWTANEGRRGPVWLDVPQNVQNARIETDNLKGFEAPAPMATNPCDLARIVELLTSAERPVLIAGSGIRTACVLEKFRALAVKLNMPVVAATSVEDVLPNGDPLYVGNFGVSGGRAGNYMTHYADVLVSFGCSMAFKHVGFTFEAFAPNATKVLISVEEAELHKPTVKIDVPVLADLEVIIDELLEADIPAFANKNRWLDYGQWLAKSYPIYLEKFATTANNRINPYYFLNEFNKVRPDNCVEVVGNSTASVCCLQLGVDKYDQRLFGNCNCGSMGYDLPAAMGSAFATGDEVYLVTGDGSIQMNIQELQTVTFHKLPVKIILFNNGGYQAIVTSQTNGFGRLSGCTAQTGMGLPNMGNIAAAYGIPHMLVERIEDVPAAVQKLVDHEGAIICEVIQDETQGKEPTSKAKKLPDGTLTSPPLYDLYPFLDEEEAKAACFDEWSKR